MQQKQVGNFFKEKLDPKELTPSCLSQELSRFPGFFFVFVFKHILQFHSYSDGAPHPRGRRERRKQKELPPSSPSTPGWTGV